MSWWKKSPLEAATTKAELEEARRAFLAEEEAAHAATLAQCKATLDAAHERKRMRTVEAEAVVARRLAEINARLAADIKPRVFSILARFTEDPAGTVERLCHTWPSHVAAVADGIGEDASTWVIVAGLLHKEGGDDAVARMGSKDFYLGDRAADAVAMSALLAGDLSRAAASRGDDWTRMFSSVGRAEKIRLLSILEAQVAKTFGDAIIPDAERAEVMLANAGKRSTQAALAALDMKRQKDEQAARDAKYSEWTRSDEHAKWQKAQERTKHLVAGGVPSKIMP